LWQRAALWPTELEPGCYTCPLWIPFAACAVPAACFWHLDRPAPGTCRCGYDLTGNMSGRCSECGQNFSVCAGAKIGSE